MRKGIAAVILIGGIVGGPSFIKDVQAFEYAGQAWCCQWIHYRVNPTNPLNMCGGYADGSWFTRVVDSAARTWNHLGTGFHLVDSGTTTLGCMAFSNPAVCLGHFDDLNTISMSSGCDWVDDNILAISTWWYRVGGDSDQCILESDICFNNNINWYTGVPPCGSVPSIPCYDLQSVALHELGHWVAANHENDDSLLGYKPVMYSAINYCEQRRVLTPDDSHLVFWAYDSSGSIALPARSILRHLHPSDSAYTNPPVHAHCLFCSCPRQGDLNDDNIIDVLDVIGVIDIAFGNSPDKKDNECPTARSDVNNNGVTDVFDVIYMIETAFNGGPNPVNPCTP